MMVNLSTAMNSSAASGPTPHRNNGNDGLHNGIILPALKAGAITGACGFVFGGVTAVLKGSSTVGLFAAASSMNWFALGSTYWAVRQAMLQIVAGRYPSRTFEMSHDRIPISGGAGAIAGATMGLLFRGKANVLPGAIMWGLMGLGGQYVYALADERHTKIVRESGPNKQRGFWDRAFQSKWSPIKKLTEEEYEKMLREKLLGVEADIALVGEEIDRLKKRSK